MVAFIIVCVVAAVLCLGLCANSAEISRYEEQRESDRLMAERQRIRENFNQLR